MARLIDGEKLKNEVASTFHGAIGLTVTGAVHEIIDRQPAIDPESLRPHGKWVKDQYSYQYLCTNCKMTLPEWLGVFNYCPYCRARLEGNP